MVLANLSLISLYNASWLHAMEFNLSNLPDDLKTPVWHSQGSIFQVKSSRSFCQSRVESHQLPLPQGIVYAFFVISEVVIMCVQVTGAPRDTYITQMKYFMWIIWYTSQGFNGHRESIKDSFIC